MSEPSVATLLARHEAISRQLAPFARVNETNEETIARLIETLLKIRAALRSA